MKQESVFFGGSIDNAECSNCHHHIESVWNPNGDKFEVVHVILGEMRTYTNPPLPYKPVLGWGEKCTSCGCQAPQY